MNWANRLTICRILLVPFFITAILYHRLDVAFVIFVVAAVTDGLDGYIARTFNQKTKLGAMMDPLADKLLIGSAFLSFSLVSGLPEYLNMPIYVPMIVISRDALILLGIGVIYLTNGDVDFKPTVVSKVTTVFQMLTIIALLLQFVYSSWLWTATACLTVISGIDYILIGSKLINGKIQ